MHTKRSIRLLLVLRWSLGMLGLVGKGVGQTDGGDVGSGKRFMHYFEHISFVANLF